MSYERLEQAITALFSAEKTLQDNRSLFEQCITEAYFDWDEGRDFDKIPEDFDFGAESWPEFPVLSEFIVAFKEEVLAKNIHSFKYDW